MAEMLLLNPRKRRKTTKTTKRRKKRRSYARNPVNTRRARVSRKARRASTGRRYRRNPARRTNPLMDQVMNAAMGATGALGLDVIMGAVPLPPQLKTGMAKHATKGLVAVAAGMMGAAFLPRGMAEKFTDGALTVVLHDAMREQVQTFAPNLTLGDVAIPYYSDEYAPDAYEMPAPELGYYQPGMVVEGDYADPNPSVGEYVDGEYGLGEYVEDYDSF